MIERLYIHVPFCKREKCSYCAFYSEKLTPNLEELYISKLSETIKEKSELCGKLKSIYIGGGTPASLSEKALDTIFSLIKNNFKIAENCEISIETNPETLNSAKMKLIANFANRISLGIQSFNPETRKILGRKSSDRDIFKAIELIYKSGIENFSIDLINSVPGQNLKSYESDLLQTLNSGVKHISSYSLTIEEGTALSKKKITNDTGLEIKIWKLHDQILPEYGFKRYEISNFALKNSECKHNLEIWFGDKYLGLGPSASSFDGKKRWTEIANFAKWLKNHPPEIDMITGKKRAAEILAFGLRTTKKWTDDKFFERTSFHLNEWQNIINKLQEYRLVKYDGKELYSTGKGLMLWDSAAEMIIEDQQD